MKLSIVKLGGIYHQRGARVFAKIASKRSNG